MTTGRPSPPSAGSLGRDARRSGTSSPAHAIAAASRREAPRRLLIILDIRTASLGLTRRTGRMLRCHQLSKSYLSGGRNLTVLKDITFQLEPGGFLAIVGPS